MALEKPQGWKVLVRLVEQSWLPVLLALLWTIWDLSTVQTAQRTPTAALKSFGGALFLSMWFSGQWLRTAKQVSDEEQLGSLREDVGESLRLLKRMTDAATADDKTSDQPYDANVMFSRTAPNEEPLDRVIEEVSRSPKGALLVLGAELERELRRLLWSTGWHNAVEKATITASVEHLVKLGVVAANLGSSVRAFLEIRNRLLHGFGVKDDEVLRAIDIGLTILRAVLAIPVEQNRVLETGLDVYEDEGGTRIRPGIKAVAIESTSPGSAGVLLRVFPTTRTDLVKGQRVTWEWKMDRVFGASWYRNPKSGQIEPAWTQSAEFAGRNLHEL